MALSMTEANIVLDNIVNNSGLTNSQKQAELRLLIGDLDVTTSGSTTILYSGLGAGEMIDKLEIGKKGTDLFN